MVIEYEKDYLRELYESGVCKNKKYRFQKPVVQKYQKRIDTLMAATRMEDLFVFNSLNFEALDNGYYSIRIDYHYRLEFNPSLISQNYFRLFLGVLAELTCWYSSTASCKVEL